MKKNTSWKFTDELSVTFQSSVSGVGEFGLKIKMDFFSDLRQCDLGTNYLDPGLNISEYTNIIHKAPYFPEMLSLQWVAL